jgi:hypothetical protein
VTRASTIAPDPPAARVRESRSVIGLSFLGIAQAVPFTVTHDGHLGNKGSWIRIRSRGKQVN